MLIKEILESEYQRIKFAGFKQIRWLNKKSYLGFSFNVWTPAQRKLSLYKDKLEQKRVRIIHSYTDPNGYIELRLIVNGSTDSARRNNP